MKVMSAVVLSSAMLFVPAVASAQANMEGYVVDRFGNPVIAERSGGTCVQSRYWTPQNANPRCKPENVPAAAAARQPKK